MNIYRFNFTGDVQEWTSPQNGYYQLEVWGAEGGTHTGVGQKNRGAPHLNGIGRGGYGGYSVGVKFFNKGEKVFIYVGGRGRDESERSLGQIYGGWNGGGSNRGYTGYNYNPTGGGGTDISTVYSPVEADGSKRYSRSYESYMSRLIVAGGGGGGCLLSSGQKRNGGHGGGFVGNDGQTGYGISIGRGGDFEKGGKSLESGGSSGEFGLGSPYGHDKDGASGGGGFYGGGESRDSGAGGGSGFIGSVTNYHGIMAKMYCYNCLGSISNRTYSTLDVSSSPIQFYAKSGDGYAVITQMFYSSGSYLQIYSNRLPSTIILLTQLIS